VGFSILLAICAGVLFAGLIGVCVTLSKGFPIDDAAASAFYRCFCFGVAGAITMLSVILMTGLSTLAKLLEEAADVESTSDETRKDLRELGTLLRKIRWQGFLNLVPQSIIPFVLQGIVLPGFWYGELITLMIVSLGGLVIWAALRKFRLQGMRTMSMTSMKKSLLVEPEGSVVSSDNPMARL
jgi:hypothetical protein